MSEQAVVLDEYGRPLLDQFSEEGFVDCTFRIAERSSDPDRHRLHLVASHDGVEVGLSVVVRRGIRGGFNPDLELIQDHVYRSAVEFLRSGPESDELISVLARLYGEPAQRLRMVDAISFTGIVSGFVFWNEKDSDYRVPLIRGLSVAR